MPGAELPECGIVAVFHSMDFCIPALPPGAVYGAQAEDKVEGYEHTDGFYDGDTGDGGCDIPDYSTYDRGVFAFHHSGYAVSAQCYAYKEFS